MRQFLATIAVCIQVNFFAAAIKVNNWIVDKINLKPITQNLALISFSTAEENTASNQDKILDIFNVSSLPILKNDTESLVLSAEAAIAFDVDSDVILFDKNVKERKPIASLTKLMTAIVALENAQLDEVVTISKNAIDTEGCFCNFRVGEQLSLESVLHIMLLRSDNDASVALAEHIGGTAENFVAMMNQKAADLGMNDTFFSCSNGLDDNENFSTAYDMAQLADYALKKPLLWDILRIQEEVVSSSDGLLQHHLKSTNKLLKYSADVLGGKTGYTEGAGECLLLVVQNPENGRRIVSVVLNSQDRFMDSQKLFEWVFANYRW